MDPEDAPDFLRAILDLHQQRDQATRDKHIWWENWRGRLGLSAEEATSLFEKASGNTIRRRKQGRVERSLGEAVVVQFRSWDGTELSYTGFVGETIKDVARRHDLVEAICGGLQECATCHVMLEGSEESLPKLPEMSEDEEYACRLQWTCIVSADG